MRPIGALQWLARQGVAVHYGVACGLVLVATLARFAIAPQEAGFPYVTYFPAATLAAVVGGIWPGLAATGLGAVAAVYFFVAPVNQLGLTTEAVVSAMVFIADEVIVCSAIEAMRRYHLAYVRATASLRQTHSALEAAHEQERRAREDSERANEAKARFLAAASHDLRQPLQALRLFVSVLAEKGAAQLPLVLPRIDEAMQAAERLLHGILDLRKLEAGTMKYEPVDIPLAQVLSGFQLEFADLAAKNGIALRVVPCSLTVHADRVVLQRILANLLSNAIKYGGQGRVLLGCRRTPDGVRVEVWDEGPGVPPDKQELIFEEFYQVGNPERDLAQGMGIGLAIARRLARASGFRLWLEQPSRGGCRFCLSVPAVPRVRPQQPESRQLEPA